MRFAGTQLSSYLDPGNFDNIAKSSMNARTTERNADMMSKAHVEQADIMGDAAVKSAKYGASATVAQGAAAGQSAMFKGLGSMASGIAGGFANMGGTDLNTAVDRTSLGHGIPGSVGGNGLPMYGPSW